MWVKVYSIRTFRWPANVIYNIAQGARTPWALKTNRVRELALSLSPQNPSLIGIHWAPLNNRASSGKHVPETNRHPIATLKQSPKKLPWLQRIQSISAVSSHSRGIHNWIRRPERGFRLINSRTDWYFERSHSATPDCVTLVYIYLMTASKTHTTIESRSVWAKLNFYFEGIVLY